MYRHTCRYNANPPQYRYAKLAVDLELTVAEEDVGRLNIPVDDHAMVNKLYCRHELSDVLDRPCIFNGGATLRETHTHKQDRNVTIVVPADRFTGECIRASGGHETHKSEGRL